MRGDCVAQEVRRIKREHAARYGYDIRRMARALREKQAASECVVVSLASEAARKERS